MVDRLSFFKPKGPKLLQIGQTPLYLYIQNIKLVCNSGLLCARLEWENVVYTQPNTKSMVDHFSFFKPRRPKLLQIGQTKHQSTPLYLYIQNITLVSNSGLPYAGLERENLVYTQPNTKLMVDYLSFFEPRRPKLLQIGQTKHQSTPLYLYILNIKLVCNSGLHCAGLEQENLVYTQPNTKSMVDHFSFFKPRRPKLLQIGQTKHQSTPLYLYIQNINLVSNSGLPYAGLERENLVYTQPNTKLMVDYLSFCEPRRPKLLQIGQTPTASINSTLSVHQIGL